MIGGRHWMMSVRGVLHALPPVVVGSLVGGAWVCRPCDPRSAPGYVAGWRVSPVPCIWAEKRRPLALKRSPMNVAGGRALHDACSEGPGGFFPPFDRLARELWASTRPAAALGALALCSMVIVGLHRPAVSCGLGPEYGAAGDAVARAARGKVE